jgi:hypothetical protein
VASENERIRAQQKDIELFVSNLDKFLYSRVSKILAGLKSGDASAIEAAKILGSLSSELKAMGLNDVLAKVQTIYADDLKAIAKRFAAMEKGTTKRLAFSDIDRPMINALIEGGYNQAANYVEMYVGDVRSQVGMRVLTGEPLDFSAVHDEYGTKLERILDTEMNTTIAAFHSSVNAAKADELGLTLFEYVGPDDKVTRDFCEGLLNERDPAIYSIDEIREMDNGTGLPVLQYRGGYNCRHRWNAVTDEEAARLGYSNG